MTITQRYDFTRTTIGSACSFNNKLEIQLQLQEIVTNIKTPVQGSV